MRVSENRDLVPDGTPPPHSRLNGHNCGFAVEMTRLGNRGKVLPDFSTVPPALGNPANDARFQHFHSDGGFREAINPKTPNPLKWRAS